MRWRREKNLPEPVADTTGLILVSVLPDDDLAELDFEPVTGRAVLWFSDELRFEFTILESAYTDLVEQFTIRPESDLREFVRIGKHVFDRDSIFAITWEK